MKQFKISAAKLIAQKTQKNGSLYYGWVILGLCALGVFFSAPGQTYFTSVFIESYIAEFGWSRSAISSYYSMATLGAGLLLFQVGRLADKYGQKKLIIAAAFVLGLGAMLTSMVTQMWMLFITFFIGRLAGQGSMTLLPSTVVPNWFIKKRALAFSLMSLGGFCGSALIPPLNSFLISGLGWRPAWRIWGIALWFLFIPLILLFHAGSPEEINVEIRENSKNSRSRPKNRKDGQRSENWDFKAAVRTRSFWGMIYVQMLLPMISTGITFHFVSVMMSKGVAEEKTPFLLSIIAVTSLVSTLSSGYLLARIKIQHAAVLISSLLVVNLFVLLLISSYPAAIVFAVIQGTIAGLQAVWAGLVWPDYFGTRYLGSIRGLAMAAMVISSALGPLPFGFIYDSLGSYDVAIYIVILMSALGIISAALSPRPQNPPHYKNAY